MATKTKTPDLLTSHRKAALRRQYIDQMMAEGTTVEGIYLAFSTRPDLQALFTGTKAIPQVLNGDIARVQQERGADRQATARADHVRGLKKTLAVAEAELQTLHGATEAHAFRVVLGEVNRLRQALAQLEGVPINMTRPVGRPRAGAGQVAFGARPPAGQEPDDPPQDAEAEPAPDGGIDYENDPQWEEPYYADDEDEPE